MASAYALRTKPDYTGMTRNERLTAQVLRPNKNTHTPTTQADKDRNAAICGRGTVNAKDQ